MSETPPSQNPPAPKRSRRLPRQTQLMLLAVILLIIVAIIVVVALVWGPGDGADDSNGNGTAAGETVVTSPYDLHELPAEAGPGDVEKASLVSISLAAADGSADYFGLSADTEPAKALMKAVADAEELEKPDTTDTTDAVGAAETTAPGDQTPGSMLTFLFPDRTTLAFDLDVDEGTIARGGRVWQVDGDLAALIDAAVSVHERQ